MLSILYPNDYCKATGTLTAPCDKFSLAVSNCERSRVYASARTAIFAVYTSGKLKALGVTSLTRVKVTPEVPTLNEDGLQGCNLLTQYVLFVLRRN